MRTLLAIIAFALFVLFAAAATVFVLMRDDANEEREAPVGSGSAPDSGGQAEASAIEDRRAAPSQSLSGEEGGAPTVQLSPEEAVIRTLPESLRAVAESLKRGDADDALERLESLLEENPHSLEVRLQLANAYLATGQFPGALEVTSAIIAEDPSNVTAYYHRARARGGFEEYREALEDIESILSLPIDDAFRAHAEAFRAEWAEKLRD